MSILSVIIAAFASIVLAGLAFTILKFSEPVIDKPVSNAKKKVQQQKKRRFGWG